MPKIINITKKFDKKMGEIIRACLEEYNLNIPGTAWSDPYLDKFSEFYKDIRGEYFIAIMENRFENEDLLEISLAGGCGYGPLNGIVDTCELQKLYISSEFRRLGIAKLLLDKIETEAQKHYKKIYLETVDSMVEAITFYEKNGYQRITEPLGDTGHNACGAFFIKVF